jgi:ferrochelatase
VTPPVDAVVIVSFGGPEGMDDVVPFLRNVTRGRRIPDERLSTVAAQYERFGGVSPLNASNRVLVAALQALLDAEGPALPVYWGNRNWDPYLTDVVPAMQRDGVSHALAFATSAYSGYSACRQYREDIARAQEAAGLGAPRIEKLRPYFDHPGFIEPLAANTRAALATLPAALRTTARLVFTAHSIPLAMAATSDYEAQLRAAARLVADRVPGGHEWDLVYQSRSGPPSQPWLEPDVVDHLTALHAAVCDAVVVVPIGFTSDHLEVRYDLDIQAQERADALGLPMARASTVGDDPAFVAMIRELVLEVIEPGPPPRRLSDLADPGWCSPTCCPPPPPRPA